MAEETLKGFDEEMNEIEAEIKAGIKKLASLREAEKADKIEALMGRVKRLKEIFQDFKLELRGIKSAVFQQKLRDHGEIINDCVQQLNMHKSTLERETLFDGTPAEADPSKMTAAQVYQEAAKVQDESLESLARSKKKIADTEEIVRETITTLAEQTEQMKRIIREVDNLRENLKQARAQIRIFFRRMVTDKITACFIILVLAAVVAVIVYSIVTGDTIDISEDTYRRNGGGGGGGGSEDVATTTLATTTATSTGGTLTGP